MRRPRWPTFPFAKNQPWIKKASILLTNIHQYLLCGKVNLWETESGPNSDTGIQDLKKCFAPSGIIQAAWGLSPECPGCNYHPHCKPCHTYKAQVNTFCLDFTDFSKVADIASHIMDPTGRFSDEIQILLQSPCQDCSEDSGIGKHDMCLL